MRNLQYELHKVEREIKTHGATYVIKRKEKDSYGEYTGMMIKVCEVKGVFHISKGFITQISVDAATVRTKGQPMLLTLYEDTKDIQVNDIVLINGKTYKIVDKNNIQEFSIVSDLSLEVFLDGTF